MIEYSPIIQSIPVSSNYELSVLRLDLLHKEVSGNKWFKLKGNIQKAIQLKQETLLTFGGAHSNHIAATASACKAYGLKSIGIIRGEQNELSPTLKRAKELGMHLFFVTRAQYANKTEDFFKQDLVQRFGKFYLVPEGGNNLEGILGCCEIMKPELKADYIICACGTGATFTGLLLAAHSKQIVIGCNVLKGTNQMLDELKLNLEHFFPHSKLTLNGNEELEKNQIENHCLINTYAFSGYAKYDKQLVNFKSQFEHQHNIPLDYIYTNKAIFAAFDLIARQKFPDHSKIMIIHSGGLQGNKAFESRYKLKFTSD